jgi:hypothetical protein
MMIKCLTKLLTYFLVFVLLGCNNDDEKMDPPCNDPSNPDCPNFDRCLVISGTSADFEILNQFGTTSPYNELFYPDSVTFGGLVKFKAIDSTASLYRWILGADTIEGGTEVRYVEKEVDVTCFPADPGFDSRTRLINYKGNTCEAQIINKFKGVFDTNPNDSVQIELLYAFNRIPTCDLNRSLNAINFFGNGDTILTELSIKGFLNKRVIWNWSNSDSEIVGELIIHNDDSVTAIYEFKEDQRNFLGRVKY